MSVQASQIVADGGLSERQRRLLAVIEHRRKHGLPTVQRDLAEALGIRRDSVNKLLARTRRTLKKQGRILEMPPRRREGRAVAFSLADFGQQ